MSHYAPSDSARPPSSDAVQRQDWPVQVRPPVSEQAPAAASAPAQPLICSAGTYADQQLRQSKGDLMPGSTPGALPPHFLQVELHHRKALFPLRVGVDHVPFRLLPDLRVSRNLQNSHASWVYNHYVQRSNHPKGTVQEAGFCFESRRVLHLCPDLAGGPSNEGAPIEGDVSGRHLLCAHPVGRDQGRLHQKNTAPQCLTALHVPQLPQVWHMPPSHPYCGF